jgi:hypothetical protein
MKKSMISLSLMLLLGIMAGVLIISADKDNNSDSNGNSNNIITASNNSDDEEDNPNLISADEDETDVETEAEDDNIDDENETEIEIDDNGHSRKIKIHEGDDVEEIRETIKEKNRFKFNSSQLPENCTKTGSAIKCDIEGKTDIEISIERKNVDLSAEAQQTLESLRASFQGTIDEVKIKIEVEKKDGEIESQIETEGEITVSQQALLDILVNQTISSVESTEATEASIKIEIQSQFREQRVMVIFAGNSGNIILQVKGINATTLVQLYKANGTIYGVTGNNETILISYFPDEIREKILERISMPADSNETIELDEDGKYQVDTEKNARFIGIFKVKEHVRFHVDPETGNILNENAPWWGFLAGDESPENTTNSSA